jgi:hypothetical protein
MSGFDGHTMNFPRLSEVLLEGQEANDTFRSNGRERWQRRGGMCVLEQRLLDAEPRRQRTQDALGGLEWERVWPFDPHVRPNVLHELPKP